MGYNVYARCLNAVARRDCHGPGMVAFIYRGHEAEAIVEWYEMHPNCRVEWAADNNSTSPRWVDATPELVELPSRIAERHVDTTLDRPIPAGDQEASTGRAPSADSESATARPGSAADHPTGGGA